MKIVDSMTAFQMIIVSFSNWTFMNTVHTVYDLSWLHSDSDELSKDNKDKL